MTTRAFLGTCDLTARITTYIKPHNCRVLLSAWLLIAVRLSSGSQDATNVHRRDEVSGGTTQEQVEPFADPFRHSGYRSELVWYCSNTVESQGSLFSERCVLDERNATRQHPSL